MTEAGFTIAGSAHPICPVMLGDARLASVMADDMLKLGEAAAQKGMCLVILTCVWLYSCLVHENDVSDIFKILERQKSSAIYFDSQCFAG